MVSLDQFYHKSMGMYKDAPLSWHYGPSEPHLFPVHFHRFVMELLEWHTVYNMYNFDKDELHRPPMVALTVV